MKATGLFWDQPLWLVGFRPFFILALAYGALLPLIWSLIFSGTVAWPFSTSPLSWHAHEMFFGFGWALLGGFLLTASKNWVKVRGAHGALLAFFVLLWMFDRFLPVLGLEGWPRVLSWLLQSASVLGPGLYVIWILVRGRKQDSFPDNFYFILLLSVLLVAKNLLLSPSNFALGWGLSLGLFRLAFVVMFERTVTQFMKNSEGRELFRHPIFDRLVKASAAASVFAVFLPPSPAAILLGLAGVLLFIRWILWRPDLGLRRFGNAVMYVGMLALSLHFLLESAKSFSLPLSGFNSLHLFTFFCMGAVGASMMVRISKGHTGRRAEFDPFDRIAIALIWVAAAFRLFLSLGWPEHYQNWISLASLCWFLAFGILLWRLTPLLVHPRVDGRVH